MARARCSLALVAGDDFGLAPADESSHQHHVSDVTELDAATQAKSFELTFQDGYRSYRALKYP